VGVGGREAARGKRVLVICLAEATLDLLEPWANDGRLPTVRELLRGGTRGRLRSQVPTITPQLWGTIVTGRSPGHHGIFDFWQRGPDGRFLQVNGSNLRTQPIWSLLTQRGRPSGILNVPFTYPPAPIDGFIVSGEDAPAAHPSIAWPAGLYDEMVRRFGRYRLKDIFPGGRQKSDYLTLVAEDVEKQTEVFAHLFATRPWDFGMAFYSATAIAQHYFWSDMTSTKPDNPYRAVIETAYRSVDRAIGRLVEVAGRDAAVFLVSDCGAGPLQAGVQVNTVLQRHGLLTRRDHLVRSRSRAMIGTLRKNVQGWLNRLHLDFLYYGANRRLGKLKSWAQGYVRGSDIDWSSTRAFSRGKEGDIFINLAGRDPHGIVMPGVEYEGVRDQVIAAFEELVDPRTGERAVTRVHRREELYSGPMTEWAPDLIIEWSDCAYMPTESDRDKGSVFVERWREYMNWPTSGGHRLDGLLVAKGPGIRAGADIAGARIIDLMPTWLACLGEPLPSDLEGTVLTGLFETPCVESAAQRTSPSR
jgi:predicted AlkP superfamily phosphohydrolase/phosphomutase